MPEFRLSREHTLNKVKRQIGEVVDVPQQTGDWWVSQGIAERVPSDVVPHMPMRFAETVTLKPRAQVALSPRFKCCGWK